MSIFFQGTFFFFFAALSVLALLAFRRFKTTPPKAHFAVVVLIFPATSPAGQSSTNLPFPSVRGTNLTGLPKDGGGAWTILVEGDGFGGAEAAGAAAAAAAGTSMTATGAVNVFFIDSNLTNRK